MRSDVTLQELTAKKTGTAGKAPPSHGGFCYFQIRFCFNVTSTPPPPNFKHFFSRSGGLAPAPSIWWSHRPKNLGSALSCLAGCPRSRSWLWAIHSTNQEMLAAGDPLPTLLNLLLGNFLQSLSPLPGRPPTLVLLGISPGPPHQNHTVPSDVASWETGNA